MMFSTISLIVGCSSEAPSSKIIDSIQDTSSESTDPPVDTAEATDTAIEVPLPLSYENALFKSSNKSYSGGTRGSLNEQLDAGIRGIELDIHNDDFETLSDFSLGDGAPGNAVELNGGNPDSALLRPWLRTISSWSEQHPDHAPITITLSLQDPLIESAQPTKGSLYTLNQILKEELGSPLFSSKEYAQTGWPLVDELRNKFVVVLSGDNGSRQRYTRAQGEDPSIAVNDFGDVLYVYATGLGGLYYWSGALSENGTVHWMEHGSYGVGFKPSVDINNAGQFIEVHEGFISGQVWYQTGTFDHSASVVFSEPINFENGRQPTVRFTDREEPNVHVIHLSQDTTQAYEWSGMIDVSTQELTWESNGPTDSLLYETERTTSASGTLEAISKDDGQGEDTLFYKSNNIEQRVQFEQLAFVEYQIANTEELQDDATFYATDMEFSSFINGWNSEGALTRLWDCPEEGSGSNIPNFPATDMPLSQTYLDWMSEAGAVE